MKIANFSSLFSPLIRGTGLYVDMEFWTEVRRQVLVGGPVKRVQQRRLPGCLQHLGFDHMPDESELNAVYRKLAASNHPDQGGSIGQFKTIQTHYEAAQKVIAGAKPKVEPPEPKDFLYLTVDVIIRRYPILLTTGQAYWISHTLFDTWESDQWTDSSKYYSGGSICKISKRNIRRRGYCDKSGLRFESERPSHTNDHVSVPACFRILGHQSIPTLTELRDAYAILQKINDVVGQTDDERQVEQFNYTKATALLEQR